ncbi:hypothetical protein HGB07_05840 [Candidatus Roizmanbacteria bacterium]|nr:hypothetical protein [Candidatus Roizmanbacteria bacterium]
MAERILKRYKITPILNKEDKQDQKYFKAVFVSRLFSMEPVYRKRFFRSYKRSTFENTQRWNAEDQSYHDGVMQVLEYKANMLKGEYSDESLEKQTILFTSARIVAERYTFDSGRKARKQNMAEIKADLTGTHNVYTRI